MTSNPSGRAMHAEINVTPMIDVLLVLVIIFMVIVPALPRGESAAVPKPAPQGSPIRESTVVLEVLKGTGGETAYRINLQPVSHDNLAARLTAIYAQRAQRVLFVEGDDQLSFTRIAEAIDIGHSAGVDRVGLITPGVAHGL